MDLGLKDRIALVAAGSKGLGFGVARALAREGARVSLCSRDPNSVDNAVRQLQNETGAEVMGVACDVRKRADIEHWVQQSVERWGRIDALLVNAGGPPAAYFKDITDEQWQAAFELTLMSTIRMIRASLPHMQPGSSILTITSSSIREPIEQLGLSTVMRAGV